jgi:hypothetical protein
MQKSTQETTICPVGGIAPTIARVRRRQGDSDLVYLCRAASAGPDFHGNIHGFREWFIFRNANGNGLDLHHPAVEDDFSEQGNSDFVGNGDERCLANVSVSTGGETDDIERSKTVGNRLIRSTFADEEVLVVTPIDVGAILIREPGVVGECNCHQIASILRVRTEL